MALNIFTDINKSIKTELSRKAIHLSSLWMPMFFYGRQKDGSCGFCRASGD
ncbi:MAG: hypothetical protein IJ479_01250 [Alphaproteobacteria bacterium]|nr:hypothetical protein [Alphaproteobacteria bacterium]